MSKHKRSAPPVTTGYDPRAVEHAPKFTDGHLPEKSPAVCHSEPVTDITGVGIRNFPVGADDSVRPETDISPSSPKAPDGISGDWQ